ncbi:MAG: hypothetical protein ACWA44_11185 [Thiotrichales bacterium]
MIKVYQAGSVRYAGLTQKCDQFWERPSKNRLLNPANKAKIRLDKPGSADFIHIQPRTTLLIIIYRTNHPKSSNNVLYLIDFIDLLKNEQKMNNLTQCLNAGALGETLRSLSTKLSTGNVDKR